MIRNARPADMVAVNAIYNHLIDTTTVAWTDVPEPLADREDWFVRQQQHGWPVIVADVDGEVVGFASYGSFRGDGRWPGYRHTVEHSVHVREDQWGRGVGRHLVEELMRRAEADGVHVIVAAIDADNASSIAFHDRLGFTEVARMPEVGTKFGRWLDLVLMQRLLAA